MSLINTEKPVIVLDERRCKRNIKKMAAKAESTGCLLRPHFKTHQSIEIGSWFKEAGIREITVSSTGMASYFASAGWNNITIAFPFFRQQLPALSRLENQARLRLFVNSTDDLEFLNEDLAKPFEVIIEINPGYGRSGIHFRDTDTIVKLIKTCRQLSKPKFHGFYVHDGRTYQANNKKEVKNIIDPTINILNNLKGEFPGASISLGDTPSASVLDHFPGIDELTPGNFVFYDWMQTQIGSCNLDDVALFALFPVAQYFRKENRAIIHGGATHLSKDLVYTNGKQNYGHLLDISTSSVNSVDHSFVTALSQEHGTISGLPDHFDKGLVWICPIHSCLTANLYDHYITTEGRRIEKRILS